jgi:hypothetical protein
MTSLVSASGPSVARNFSPTPLQTRPGSLQTLVRRALEGVSLDAERGYLCRRLAECEGPAMRTTTPTR